MISVIIVSFLFRLFNLLIISVLFFHVCKKYLYPFFKDQLTQYLTFLRKLRDKISAARKQQVIFEKDFIEQKNEARILLEKTKVWQSDVVQRQEKNKYELNMRLESIKSVRKKQQEHYVEMLKQRLLIPKAFMEASLVLSDKYQQDKNKAEQFITFITRSVERELK